MPWQDSISRARALAARYPHAADLLLFYAQSLELLPDFAALRRFAAAHAPGPLSAAALEPWDPPSAAALYLASDRSGEPAAFFARLWLRAHPPPPPAAPDPRRCPQCGQPPQCGVLRPEGHGRALSLVCSLCLAEWPYPRNQCPSCPSPAALEQYQPEMFPHLSAQACPACRTYLHLLDLSLDPAARPEPDELAAAPVDLWLRERGFRKIFLNLAGI